MDYDPSIGDFYPRKLTCIICSCTTYDHECSLIPYGEFDQEAICPECLIKMVSNHKRSEKEKRYENK